MATMLRYLTYHQLQLDHTDLVLQEAFDIENDTGWNMSDLAVPDAEVPM